MGALMRLPNAGFWAGKKVFLTGHTGFKGGWLSMWLQALGAEVCGFALPPATTPNLFEVAGIANILTHHVGDIRNRAALASAMRAFQPDVVLHLAAQALVRESYQTPVETFATNVMGTLYFLDAVRAAPSVQATVIVTSDKVYAESLTNRHDEAARLGGRDPYSASKACAELAVASFPMLATSRVATVRSGNVIGGGDWAADRLIADFMRAMMQGEALEIRNPRAVRPWQHVLDPLCGYLLAAETVCEPLQTWNFGPPAASEIDVETLAVRLCAGWGGGAGFKIVPQPAAPHEAMVLRLNSDKAQRELGWQPGYTIDAALDATIAWYKAYAEGQDMAAFTRGQIDNYQQQGLR
jgi:CDP-glucose 4,6-dehydratase